MAKTGVLTVTGVTNPISASVSSSHGNAVAVAIIKTESTTLSVGDSISVSMGYVGNVNQIFTGYVKRVERTYPDGIYNITAHDVLVRAADYFIASKNPENPLKYYRIDAEDLIGNLLSRAGLTNYVGDTTNFIYAWTVEAEVNLVGTWDFCKQLADMLAWHIYAKPNGQIRFLDRKPYLMAGDTAQATVTHPSIFSISKHTTMDNLRNRVVVYGANGIFAEAKSSSPYLPAGFYKTAVLSTFIIDRQDMAQTAANYNLNSWNRLTNGLNLTIEGDSSILAHNVIKIVDSEFLSLNSDWYVYSTEHKYDSAGYTTNMELRQ